MCCSQSPSISRDGCLLRKKAGAESRYQEMRDFRGTSYAREASNKTPPNMSVSAK